MLIAIGAAIAVLTGIGAGIGIGLATYKNLLLGCALAEATAIYGFVIGLLIIIMLG